MLRLGRFAVSFHVLSANRNKTQNTTANQAKLIKGGWEYFLLLRELIDGAKHRIHLQFYIFDPDETGKTIGKALLEAALRGVEVYILLDAYGSQKLSRNFINRWKDAGIHFRWFQPFFKSDKFYLGRRLHHKVVVVDSIHSLVSGLNISNRYNDTAEAEAWLDWGLYCRGSVSRQLEEVCRKRMKLRATKDRPEESRKSGSCEIGVRVNDWLGRRQEITRMYLRMLRDARESVVIMTPYFMPGYEFKRSLRAATKRGVHVQMILTENSDIPIAKYAERYLYHWLFRNKIEIWEYQKNILHGKIASIDGKSATVGSYNVNNLSAYASIELNLEVIDKELAGEIEKRLHEVIMNDCVQITPEAFKKRDHIFNRIAQTASYNFFRFMLFLFTLRIRHPE
jgi:cardiolipin synthase A/B